ncbi:MAG: hypothetical protein PHG00_17675, partial [Methylococcales bacterium]|nr:hypothetical protein [Methylococcales bacterium]
MQGNALSVALTTSIGALTTVTSTSGLITFTGAVTNAGNIGTVSGSELFTSTLDNSGTLSLGAGTATSTGSLTNTGTINQESGKLALLADYSGAGAFNGQSGTTWFYGTADQSIRGVTFYNLEVRKSAGTATIVTADATLDGTLALEGAGTLNAGDRAFTALHGISIVGSTVTSTTGTLTLAGIANAGFIGSSRGNMLFPSLSFANAGGVLNIGSGTATSTISFPSDGTINGNSGTIVLMGGPTAMATWQDGATFNAQAGTVKYARTSGAQAVNCSYTYNNLDIETESGNATLGADCTVNGTLKVGTSSTLDADVNSLTVAGTTNNLGTTTSTSGTLTFNGAVTNSGAIGSVDGSKMFGSTLANSGILNIGSGVATSTGTLDNSGGTINGDTGTLIFLADFVTPAPGTFNSGTGTIRLNGGADQSIRGYNYNNVEVYKTGGIATLTNANAVFGGTLFVTGGTLSAGAVNLLVINNTTIFSGTVTSTTGNLDFFSAVGNGGSVGSSEGDILFEGALLNSGNLDVGSGTVTTTDAVSGAGIINGNTGTLVASSTLAFTTFNAGTGTLRLYGSGAQDITGATFYNLDVKKSANTATIITNDATVGGTLTTEGAGTLDLQANALLVSGLSTIGTGTTVTSTDGSLTFTLAVTNAGSIGSVSGNKLFSATLANSGILNIGSGVATTTGTFNNSGGTINCNTGKFVLAADFISPAPGTFNANICTVTFYGAADQSIRGMAFYNLENRKSAGTATFNTANVTVANVFDTYVGGTLSAGLVNFTVSGGTTIRASTTVTSTSGTLAFAAVNNAGSLGSSSGPITMTSLTNSGTLGLGAESTSTGSITSSGTIRLNGETLNVGGNWTDTGTLTPVGGGVKFNGGGAQSIGTEANFYNFGVNKLAGVATLTGNVSTTNFLLTSGTLAVADKIFYAPAVYANAGLVTRTTGKIKHTSDYENFVNSSGVTQTAYTTPGTIYLEVK